MAKKTKKGGRPKAPRMTDPRVLATIDWNEVFDPRGKTRIPVDISWIVSLGFDYRMFQAVWITNQIVQAVIDSLATQGKGANGAAMAEWRGKLQVAVHDRLGKGGDWNADGAKVLQVASDMGTIAGLLAGAFPEAGQNQLKSAFAATKSHTTCAATGGGVAGGAWCTFDWF